MGLVLGHVGSGVGHPRAGHHAGEPATQECPPMEEPGVEPEDNRWEGLEYPHPAEELEVDRELRAEHDDEGQGARFDEQ